MGPRVEEPEDVPCRVLRNILEEAADGSGILSLTAEAAPTRIRFPVRLVSVLVRHGIGAWVAQRPTKPHNHHGPPRPPVSEAFLPFPVSVPATESLHTPPSGHIRVSIES